MTCYAVLKSKYNHEPIHTSPLYASSKQAENWIKRMRKSDPFENEYYSEIIVVVED